MERLTELLARADGRVSPWEAVSALVPARVDLAIIFLHERGALRVKACAHVDPLQHPVIRTFQQAYSPAPDDPTSAAAQVFRTGTPILVRPPDAAVFENALGNLVLRGTFRALGPRNTMIVPLIGPGPDGRTLGVLVASMMASGRPVDEDDLLSMAAIGRALGQRLPALVP